MSEDAIRAHIDLLKSRACAAILNDLSLLEVGVQVSASMLAERWVLGFRTEGIERRHLEAVRRTTASRWHPDRANGNARIMALANTALDAALAEIDRLTALDVKIVQMRKSR